MQTLPPLKCDGTPGCRERLIPILQGGWTGEAMSSLQADSSGQRGVV